MMKGKNSNMKSSSSNLSKEVNTTKVNNNNANTSSRGKSNEKKGNNNTTTNKNEEYINYDKDEKYAENQIINKLSKRGFESLTIEELAVTLISPTFEQEYLNRTGQEWSKENKSKAIERLNYAKFNIQWNTKLNSTNPANLKAPFSVLFDLVERGDIQRVTEYLRKNAQYQDELLYCVDKNKKSILHIAAKCGHTNLVSVLISRGYSIHMRDKFLRTPLHAACQNSRGTVADVLIKAGSDVYARDTIGRTSLHYAATSNSVELIVLLLGIDPDLVHTRDTYGRTPLHYVVWNGNHFQLEIARKLLDAKAEVDALDEEQMTPLHYAADAGKGKIIPLLLKCGANPFLRDGRTHRTALELALTEHIREIIIVYSGKPYQVQKEDLNEMQLNGEKVDLNDINNNNTNEEFKRGRQKSQPRGKKLQQIDEVRESNDKFQEGNNNINDFLFKSQKEKLNSFLKNIQEYGVKSMQHLTKPSLYSGSWLENVKNIEDLFQVINQCTPTEAVLKIFNILSPYQNVFPQGKGEEGDMAYFFNEPERRSRGVISKNNSNMNVNNNYPNNVIDENTINSQMNNEVKGEIEKQNKNLESQRSEIDGLKDTIKNLQKNIDDINNPSSETLLNNPFVNELKSQISKYESENTLLKINSDRLLENIKSLSDNISNYKQAIEMSKRKEQQSQKLIESLTLQLKELKAEVGKLQETEKKNIQSTLSNNIGFGVKTIRIFNEGTNELSLNDEKSIYVFLKLVEEKSLGLDHLLTQFDKDNDLFIFKNEMMNLLEEINLPMEDRAPVINLAGFNSQKMRLPIKNIIDNFYKREERKNTKLNELLFKLAYLMHNKFVEIEKIYEFLNLNDEKSISLNELKQGLNSLDLILPESEVENIFRCLCIDNQNKIALGEFIEKLNIRKKIVDEIGDIDSKIRYNINNRVEEENIGIGNDNENEIDNIQNDVGNSDKKSSFYDYDEIITSNKNRNAGVKNSEIFSKNNENSNDREIELEENKITEYDETIQEDIDNNNTHNTNNTKNANNNVINTEPEDENQKIINNFMKNKNKLNNPSQLSNNEKSSNKNSSLSQNPQTTNKNINANNTKQSLDSNKKINGELKIQVKNVESIILPSSLSKPYTFYLTGSLKGLDVDFDSKEVVVDNCKVVNFNWASRILIKNKSLAEMGSLFKLELKIKTNRGTPVVIGECMLNWTTTLLPDNLDKFIIADRFQLLSKRMASVGIIAIQAKFIPFGSVNSLFDKDGKKNKIPTTMKGLLNKDQLEKIVNKEDDLGMEGIKSVSNLNEALQEENEEEKTIIKSIDCEIINIADKQYLTKKQNLFFTIQDDSSGGEIFTSKDTSENINDVIGNLPFNFNLNVYTTNKTDKIALTLFVKESGMEEITVGKINLVFDAKQNFVSVSDKYPLEVVRKNYFATNKNKSSGSGNNIVFFMKFTIENVPEDVGDGGDNEDKGENGEDNENNGENNKENNEENNEVENVDDNKNENLEDSLNNNNDYDGENFDNI